VVIVGQHILMIDVTCREPLTKTRAKAIANISESKLRQRLSRNCDDIEDNVGMDEGRMYSIMRRAEKEKWDKYQDVW
jgi:hypothetical protein